MKQMSLRAVLIYPYICLIILLAIAIGSLSYLTGTKAILTVSENLLNESLARISQEINRHIDGSAATLEAAFPNGMVAPDNIESDYKNIRTRFWIATSLHIDPNNYVYYGNSAGQAIGLYRHSYSVGELRVKFKSNNHRKRYRIEAIDGSPRYQSTEEKLFDPRIRPWYQAAEAATTDIWTPVYIDFGTHELVTTRARKVLNRNKEVAGVVATDVSLQALNEFIGSLEISPNGVAFIIEPDGNLIASSCSPNVTMGSSGKNVRINASDSSHQSIREVYSYVQDHLNDTRFQNIFKTFFFIDSHNNEIHVAINRFQNKAGLKWINVVAIPRKDFTEGIEKNVYQTLLIGILATLLVLLIGFSILQWVSKDLKRLSQAVNKIGSGQLEEKIDIQRRDEIGALAKSFSAMQRRLQSDHLTGLPNRYAFEQYLQGAIENYNNNERKVPFAILFIDLNNFKIINDNFGHDKGDQVLIEIALRLKTHIRQGDFVARYAGDEFVILLNNVQQSIDITPVTINLENAFANPLNSLKPNEIIVKGSIGAALFPKDGDNTTGLLRVADQNMYKHKADSKEQDR